LEQHRLHIVDKLEREKIDTQASRWVNELLDSDWGRRLPPQAVTTVKALWDFRLGKSASRISTLAATIRKRILDAQNILAEQDDSPLTRLSRAMDRYQEGLDAYESVQVPLALMQDRDALERETRTRAEKDFAKQVTEQSRADTRMLKTGKREGWKSFLKGQVKEPGSGMGAGEVQAGVAEGGDPSLSGWEGYRATYGGQRSRSGDGRSARRRSRYRHVDRVGVQRAWNRGAGGGIRRWRLLHGHGSTRHERERGVVDGERPGPVVRPGQLSL
jgi:hypothetical protein